MDALELIQSVLDYYQSNTAAAVSVTIIVLFLLIKKPKLLFYLILLLAAGLGIMVLFAKLSSSGLEHRKLPFVE